MGVVGLVYKLIAGEYVGDKKCVACRFSEEYKVQGYPQIGDYDEVGWLGDFGSNIYPNGRNTILIIAARNARCLNVIDCLCVVCSLNNVANFICGEVQGYAPGNSLGRPKYSSM